MEQIFNQNWFKRHQKLLLWLLNASLTKPFIRKFFLVRDCSLEEEIDEIGTSHYRVRTGLHDQRGVYYTDTVNSRLLREFFNPILWTLHNWDMKIANRFFPILNLGFDFTYNPNASAIDGRAATIISADTWANLRAAAGTTHTDLNDFIGIYAGATLNTWVRLYRMFMLFDTRKLPTQAVISAANIQLDSNAADCDPDTFVDSVGISASSPASNTALADADYGNISNTAFCDSPISQATLHTVDGYQTYVLNSSGRANITKAGISKFAVRYTSDITNTQPTWAALSPAVGYVVQNSGTGTPPKLVITFTNPGLFPGF